MSGFLLCCPFGVASPEPTHLAAALFLQQPSHGSLLQGIREYLVPWLHGSRKELFSGHVVTKIARVQNKPVSSYQSTQRHGNLSSPHPERWGRTTTTAGGPGVTGPRLLHLGKSRECNPKPHCCAACTRRAAFLRYGRAGPQMSCPTQVRAQPFAPEPEVKAEYSAFGESASHLIPSKVAQGFEEHALARRQPRAAPLRQKGGQPLHSEAGGR